MGLSSHAILLVLNFRDPIPLRQPVSEHEVMRLAGHADFATTHRFYLAIADDLLDRACEVTSGRKLAQMHFGRHSERRLPSTST